MMPDAGPTWSEPESAAYGDQVHPDSAPTGSQPALPARSRWIRAALRGPIHVQGVDRIRHEDDAVAGSWTVSTGLWQLTCHSAVHVGFPQPAAAESVEQVVGGGDVDEWAAHRRADTEPPTVALHSGEHVAEPQPPTGKASGVPLDDPTNTVVPSPPPTG